MPRGSGARAPDVTRCRAFNLFLGLSCIDSWIMMRIAGQWRDGLQHGHGVCEYAEGLRYEGGWQRGVRCGRGILTAQGYKYDGEWVDDRQHGQGAPSTA